MAKKKQKKGGRSVDRAGSRPGGGSAAAPLFFFLSFLVAATFVYGRCAHVFLGMDYAPALVGLAVLLGISGAIAGGVASGLSGFRQNDAVAGMACVLAALVLLAPSFKVVSPGPDDETASGRSDVAAGADRDRGGASSAQGPADVSMAGGFDVPAGSGTSSAPSSPMALGLMAVLRNAPPQVPEPPPDTGEIARLSEDARRFLFGFANGDDSLVESYASDGALERIRSQKVPASWKADGGALPFDDIVVENSAFDGSRVEVDLSVADRGKAKVFFSNDNGWEVSELVLVPRTQK